MLISLAINFVLNIIKKVLILATIWLTFIFNTFSQNFNIGIPSIVNYTRNDYNEAAQNWSITQDSSGVMYFANDWGVLEFDGISWNKYGLKRGVIARSVLAGKNGVIWVGGANEFGYLFPKQNGKLSYRSLSDSLDDNLENFGGVWSIIETTNGVYFQSKKSIFLYNDSVKQIYKSDDLNRACQVKDEIFVNEEQQGLLKLNKDSIKLVKGGEQFKNKNVVAILPYDKELKVIVTALHGLYLLRKNGIVAWNNANSDLIKSSNIYTAIKHSGYIFLGTTSKGLIIIDTKGNVIKNYTIQGGLQSNSVSAIYVDKNQNCWLGLQNGIDYIKLNSAVTNIVAPGSIGSGYTSSIFKENYYLGTNQGVYTISKKELFNNSTDYPGFKKVPSLIGQVWKLQVIDEDLFVGTHNGAYTFSERGLRKLSNIHGFWWFKKITHNPDVVISGTYDGLHLFKRSKDDGLWYYSHRVKNIEGSIRFAEILTNGDFWFSGGRQGVFNITFTDSYDSIIAVEKYNTDKGLPQEEFNYHPLTFNDELYVSTSSGIYKFNRKKNIFDYDRVYTNLLGESKIINHQYYGDNNMFFFQDQELNVLNTNLDGSKDLIHFGLNELKRNYISSFENLFALDNSNLFIGNQDGFVHFNPKKINENSKNPIVLIREIWHGDSILYGGDYYDIDKKKILKWRPEFTYELPFSNNSIHFKFATTDFSNVANNKFSYYLEGFDDDWEPFSKISEKEYTYLLEGTYVFRVKAMNELGAESEEAFVKLIINPPWYRSGFAYAIYLIAFVGLTFLVFKMNSKRLEEEKGREAKRLEQELFKTQEDQRIKTLKVNEQLMRMKNEKLRLDNKLRQSKIDNQTKEMAAVALQLTNRNEILLKVKQKLESVSKNMVHAQSKDQIDKLAKRIGAEMNIINDWKKFELNFDQVHEDFLKKLRTKYPSLTPKEVRLAAYLRMNMSSKEIALLQNVTSRSVEVSRYRLRKKMDLDRSINLVDYLSKLF
ncbi:hypothetical protein E9993_22005 [Labilibacter sediminis]|nr:hypothetical protein E9993_22005 [Labilibacter sediminis]